MKYLLLAEKPSLCKEIQACYKKHYVEVTSKVGQIDFIALAGHVCTNYQVSEYTEWKDSKWEDITYPMIPKSWKVKPIEDARKKQIIKTIKEKIMSGEYDGLINACDSDQEGYGIFYLLMEYLSGHHIKTLRFMEHSLTDSEILKSLLSMTDLHTDPVHVQFVNAFRLRSQADWLYGMNLTCLMSVKLDMLLTVGRVKAPTIKLVYDNSVAIENFKSRKYFELTANYAGFTAVHIGVDGKPVEFDTTDGIPAPPITGIVTKKVVERVKTHAQKLFDLTSIQAEAGRQFGYKPNETLEIIQSLYEKHKVISYPRTQCQYVSAEKAKEFPAMLRLMDAFPELAPYVAKITDEDINRVMNDKQVVNDKEVLKESHDALLPTDKRPVLEEMTEKEKTICLMIYKRLLAQFLPIVQEDKTTLFINHGEYEFLAKGKTVIDQGWRVLYKESKDAVIPDLQEGESITAEKITPVEKTTKAPKRMTQADLISAMKNIASQIEDPELKKSLADSQGIGTPATRAAIIVDIMKRGYIYEQKNGLYISEMGKTYIKSLEGIDIISPVFAAQIDTDIKKVQRGEATYDEIYGKVIESLKATCKQVESKTFASAAMTEYTCPNCGEKLRNQKFSYTCPSCELKIPKQVCGKVVDEGMMKLLFDGKPTAVYSFKKKDGTPFKARLVLTNEGLKFDFSSGVKCPLCGKETVKINKGGAFCDCGLKVFRKMAGHEFTDKELKSLVTKKKVTGIVDFVSKSGKTFAATVVLNADGSTGFEFESSKPTKKKK